MRAILFFLLTFISTFLSITVYKDSTNGIEYFIFALLATTTAIFGALAYIDFEDYCCRTYKTNRFKYVVLAVVIAVAYVIIYQTLN